jgi:hypothetical protein
MLPDARARANRAVYIQPMNYAERVADHVNGAAIGDEDAPALNAYHRDPRDGLAGRWPLGEVGAKLDARESNLNYSRSSARGNCC